MPEEQTKTPLELVTEKFTKATVYSALVEVLAQLSNGGDFEAALSNLADAVKPQKGGGASANPMKVVDGINYHYCRFKDDYVEESLMNMSGGKSKGTSILASKIAYRIGRKAAELKDQSLACFVSGDYENGARLNAESADVDTMIDLPATFTDEAMAISEFNPNFGKDTEESADNAEII